MQTSIKLQELFTYSLIPLIISSCLIIILTVYLIYSKKNKKETNLKIKKNLDKNQKNIQTIEEKYLKRLDAIECKYKNNKISLRKSYQSISEAIRLFVFEVTDIKTQNYSLSEIKTLNMPTLYELIKEYYEPEFASRSEGDFEASINNARRVIKQWN